jgi:hypothetical protein
MTSGPLSRALSGPLTSGIGHALNSLGFSLDAFLAAMSDGFRFNFSRFDNQFQESTGPTLADDVGDAVGLMLDDRQWGGRTLTETIATATEQRDQFALTDVGSPPSVAAYDGDTGIGEVSRTDASNQSYVRLLTANASGTYLVDFENTSGDTLSLRNSSSGVNFGELTAGQRTTLIVPADSTHLRLAVIPSGSVTFTVHSFKEIPGNRALQATSGSRPARAVFYGYSDDQPELAASPITSTDWSLGAGWSIGSGLLSFSAVSANADYGATLTIGKPYQITYTIDAISGGSVSVNAGGAAGIIRNAAGTYTETLVASSATYIRVQPRLATTPTGSISNISVKEVPASRISTGIQGDGTADNLLTNYYANVQLGAELVVPGAWGVTSSGGTATATESPSGTLNLTGDGSFAGNGDQAFTTQVGKTYRINCSIATSQATLRVGPTQNSNANLNVSTTGTGSVTFSFVASSTTTWVRFARGGVGTAVVSSISVKEITNQDNFIVAYVNVPTTISATSVICGTGDAASLQRFILAFNTSGNLCGGVGTQSISTIVSTATDWRGKSVVLGISFDGATVRLFADDELVYEAPQRGAPTTQFPFRILSNNAGGADGSRFSGIAEEIIAGPEFLTLDRYRQIRRELIGS